MALYAHLTEALELQASAGLASHEPVADPAYCDTLPTGKSFEYQYSAAACACFFVFTGAFQPYCPRASPRFNPFHEPENYHDLCISEAEYADIFNHRWGEDCIAGTPDDPHQNPEPEIRHHTGAEECEAGQTWNPDLCACTAAYQCSFDCGFHYPYAPVLNPLKTCECIGEHPLLQL